jgi:hypothetical protein
MVYGEDDTLMRFICYDEKDIVKVIKMETLRWLGHLFRMQELDPCRRLTVRKPEDTRRVGKLRLIWLESVEEDLSIMGVGNWRLKVAGPRRVEDNFGRG